MRARRVRACCCPKESWAKKADAGGRTSAQPKRVSQLFCLKERAVAQAKQIERSGRRFCFGVCIKFVVVVAAACARAARAPLL